MIFAIKEDIKLNPDIFDGTVNRDELRKILSEATRKVNMVNSPNFQPIFSGDYSDYVVNKFITDNHPLLFSFMVITPKFRL